MIEVGEILAALDRIAPWNLAESWDQVGLQVGRKDQAVRRLLVALDLQPAVIEEGLALQVDGFITHHPLIFKPLTRIDLRTPLGESLQRLLKANLVFIAAHTNVDKAPFGLNHHLAKILGIEPVEPLERAAGADCCKIAVFAPPEYGPALHQAMTAAGAGRIGEYEGCAFQVLGRGIFKPRAAARPWAGQPGEQTELAEVRLEMVVPQPAVYRVIAAIRANHPYEEPAIDVLPLLTPSDAGLGRIGALAEPCTLAEFCQVVQERLRPNGLRVTGDPQRKIRRVALCSGSGGSLLKVAMNRGVDLYVSGDLGYHDFLSARENGIALIDAGHWATERIFSDWLIDNLDPAWVANAGLELIASRSVQEEPYLLL